MFLFLHIPNGKETPRDSVKLALAGQIKRSDICIYSCTPESMSEVKPLSPKDDVLIPTMLFYHGKNERKISHQYISCVGHMELWMTWDFTLFQFSAGPRSAIGRAPDS